MDLEGLYQCFGDQLYLLPELLPDLGKLKIARNGLHLGTFKKKRFEPSFALGLALKPSQVKQSVEIDQEEFVKYGGWRNCSAGRKSAKWLVPSFGWWKWSRFCKSNRKYLEELFSQGLEVSGEKLVKNCILCYSGSMDFP